MISAVFDCMVFLQATTSKTGVGASCIDLVENGHVGLFLSPAIIAEIHRVFLRPSMRKKFPLLTEEKAENFLKKVTTLAVVVHDVPAEIRLDRDPKDEPYLNLALATKASFLVSRDKDLLSLMDDEAFRKAYPALSIIQPPAFLAHVRAEIGKKLGQED